MSFQVNITQSHLLILLLICIVPCPSYADLDLPVVFGYFVQDFYTINSEISNKENLANQWTKASLVDSHFPTTSDCDGWFLLGGVGIIRTNGYYRRVYSGIPTHNIVYYVIYLIIIDNWQATDYFSIQFNSDPAVRWYPLSAKTDAGSALCGNMADANNNDLHFRVIGKYINSFSSLALKITSGVASTTTAGFGIHYVKMSFYNRTTGISGQQTYNCSTYDGDNGVSGSTCACAINEYADSTNGNACTACDPSCYHCYGPGNTGCYVCSTGYYWDGTKCVASSTCPTGCDICSPNNNRCSVCDATHALLYDYSCIDPSTCSSPDSIELGGTYQFCRTPCQDNSTYMLWNANCTSNCNFPLQTRTVGSAKFCDYKCTSSSQYLYINGTCTTSCNYFPRLDAGYLFCDPCLPLGYYKNWLGECMDACPAPMPSRSEGGYLSCDNPCSNVGDYYYPRYGACKTGCKYPFKIFYAGICILDITEDEEDLVLRLGNGRKGLGYFTSTATILVSAVKFWNPVPSFAFALTEILYYIRYMDVKYPPKLVYFFEHEDDSFDDLFWFVPGIIEEKFDNYPLPDNFEYYGPPSNFFINFSNDLISLLAIFAATLIVFIIFSLLPKKTKIYSVFEKIKSSLKWNYFLSIFNTFYCKIILATSFEVRTLHLDSNYSISSFAICCIVNVLAVFLFFLILYVLKSAWTIKGSNKNNNQFSSTMKSRWGDFEVAFDSFRSDSIYKLLFLPVFIATQYFFIIMIAFVFEYPMVQATFITAMNITMLLYILITFPFKQVFDFGVILVQQVFTTAICVCVLILAIFDQGQIESYDQRDVIGDIILISSFVSISIAIVYLLYHLYLIAEEAYRLIKTHFTFKIRFRFQFRTKKKVAPVKEMEAAMPTEHANINNLSQISMSPELPPEVEAVQDLFKPKNDSTLEKQSSIVTTSSGLVRIPRLRLDSLDEYVRPLDNNLDQSSHHWNASPWDDSMTQSIKRPLPRTSTVSTDYKPRSNNPFVPLPLASAAPEQLKTSFSLTSSPGWSANQKKKKRMES